MLVLLIEDDRQKADRVSAVLRELRSNIKIVVQRSYQSGLRQIDALQQLDLIILDMSLPTFDPSPDRRPGRPRPLGGYEVMRKIRRKGSTVPIIVLTALENFGARGEQFTLEELNRRCHEEFSETFLAAIYYSQSKNAWINDLREAIGQVGHG